MPLSDSQKSLEVQAAAKLQLKLDQPMSDITTGLVNHDFEGDFFKQGDTVSIFQPDEASVKVELGGLHSGTEISAAYDTEEKAKLLADTADQRLDASDLKFNKTTMQIDKYAKYAFLLSDITEAEGKWNYKSGNLDLVAHKMRKAHNVEISDLILNDTAVQATATANGYGPAAPIVIDSVDKLYEEVIIPLYATLYDAGAITQDGQVTYGSNPEQQKQTHGNLYVPTKMFTQLLKSKYLTDRSTVAADEKVKTGIIKTVMGLDIAIEPSLVSRVSEEAGNYNQVTVPNATAGTFCIIAGTRNAVTRAGKVLTPESFRSHKRYATEYHGMEIYGQRLMSPESVAVAFCKFAD